ncbi:MAG: peptidase S8 [Candidatus Sericytochromatia bacterium]|nr:peptidase S8 [Candidatus Tanganyikabacteria bacterium]
MRGAAGSLDGVLREVAGRHVATIPELGVAVVALPAGADAAAAVAAARAVPGIALAERDAVAYAVATPVDPGWSNQWGLRAVSAEQAWDLAKGAGTRVAVLDTGIDQNHADLAAKLCQTCGEADQKDFTASRTGVDDHYGHGTHVAGIAAAITDNGVGVAGAGWSADLLNGKVLNDSGWGYYSWIAAGIVWAADRGAHVISMSLGGYSGSAVLGDAVDYAWGKGSVLVAAAGNDNTASQLYPAAYGNCVAVSAIDQAGNRASFSNYGSWVDVAAPGVSIYSTLPNHKHRLRTRNYGYLSGTSMATPFVAGEAALVWQRLGLAVASPNNSAVRSRLERSAVAGNTGSRCGRIDLYNAVSGDTSETSCP